MKTAITEIMDLIEMEHNNSVEISQRVLWKMLFEAKEKEKQQIIEAFNYGFSDNGLKYIKGEEYYKDTFNTTNKETLK